MSHAPQHLKSHAILMLSYIISTVQGGQLQHQADERYLKDSTLGYTSTTLAYGCQTWDCQCHILSRSR